MDNQRLFLYAGLMFISILIWQEWQADYAPRPQSVNAPQSSNLAETPVDGPSAEPSLDVPELDQTAADELHSDAPVEEVVISGESPRYVTVMTDVFSVLIDTKGGTIAQVELLAFPVSLEQQDQSFRLMSAKKNEYFVAQSGLLAADKKAPTHHDQFKANQQQYVLADGADEIQVPLYWQKNGIKVTKTYTFKRDTYLIELNQKIDNSSQQVWRGSQYRQLQRKAVTEDEESRFIYTFIGGVTLDEENKYEKIDFDDFKELADRDINNSWAAIIQHYFLAAWVPDPKETNTYYTKALNSSSPSRYVFGLKSPSISINAGQQAVLSSRLYVGPKDQDRLKGIAEKVHLTVDYGMLTIIAEPLFWLLSTIYDYVGNWGLAIILVTLVIKLVFYKLSEASYKSMARMRKLQPKMVSLKERYGDDRQKLGQATMDLYRKEKVNPLGGCLPMLVQIPVFIALYWTLLESVELRQAPFIFWIQDLSVNDPFYVLPLLMGITMFFQQKLNPAPADPIQAKVFMMLPFVFTVFFAFFPAGLVLYWVANNLLSIAQQYYITRYVIGT